MQIIMNYQSFIDCVFRMCFVIFWETINFLFYLKLAITDFLMSDPFCRSMNNFVLTQIITFEFWN